MSISLVENSKEDPNQNFGFVVFKEHSVASYAKNLNWIWNDGSEMVVTLVVD